MRNSVPQTQAHFLYFWWTLVCQPQTLMGMLRNDPAVSLLPSLGWVLGRGSCYSMTNLFRCFITHPKWTPFSGCFQPSKMWYVIVTVTENHIFKQMSFFSYDFCIPLWITAVGGRERIPCLDVQNLIPGIHRVLEIAIIGHISPPPVSA